MNQILVSGIKLNISNARETLSMGGPFIGDLSIGDDFISKDCILDNFVYNKDMNLLFFVKFNRVSIYYRYFSVNFYNINTKTVFQFDRAFDMVHLGNFKIKNELEIYPAFHAQFKEKQQIFDLDQEEFHQV